MELFRKFRDKLKHVKYKMYDTYEPYNEEEPLEEKEREWERFDLHDEKGDYYRARGQRIRAIRMNLGLSPAEMAEKLSVPEEYLNNIESGEDDSSKIFIIKDLLLKMFTCFNINPVYIVGGSGKEFLDEEEARFYLNLEHETYPGIMLEILAYAKSSPLISNHFASSLKRIASEMEFWIIKDIDVTSKQEKITVTLPFAGG
jgi:transcriptional regulator with XRE-family HTH domain